MAGLRFFPSHKVAGFASKATSSDNDANPAVVVRELLQNSVDAGVMLDRPVAVEFVFDEIEVEQIPGIESYRSAFEAARQLYEVHSEASEDQIDRISSSLSKSRVPVLKVFDNGVGLNAKRTNALLGDGLTSKVGDEARAGGSYGVGHYTAFPASDLQYVLYGGVCQDHGRTMSGHAILASHRCARKGELMGQDGYFIAGINEHDILRRYQFPRDNEILRPISLELDRIEQVHRCGTVVILLAFNNFRDDPDPAKSILRTAARHFYPIVRSGNLVVRTKGFGGDAQVLDATQADKLLFSERNERRSRTHTINGSKAYAISSTIRTGEFREIATKFGTVKIYARQADPDEGTRISLFRSGMFITDIVPLNQPSVFAQYRNFNAVILFDTPKQGEEQSGFGLVRQSEGEKHTSVNKRLLPKQKQRDFDSLFRSIRKAIKEGAIRDDADSFTPEGFMELELSVDADALIPGRPNTGKPKRNSTSTEFTPIPELLDLPVDILSGNRRSNVSKGPKSSRSKASRDQGRRVPVLAAAQRDGRAVRMVIKATEDVPNAALRLLAHRGADASCTTPLPDEPLRLRIRGTPSSFVQTLPIGQFTMEQRREFNIELEQVMGPEVVIKVDVFSRRTPASARDDV
ncbi:MAG: hypothetical protein OXB95_05270 [Rhodobacteraceae bacterium]|nr:hypothetical protein [Paracoccaceae bacterium]